MTGNWRERTIAATVHFVVTLAMAGLAAAIIFLVWFPGALASMVGGTSLFLLVVVSDLVLGPLMSLVIYSSKKSLRELVIDYAVIGAAQIAALIYGVLVVAASRPAYIAFDVDRLEVVTAIEIEGEHLAAATDPQFSAKSWTGPKLAAVVRPTDAEERADLEFFAPIGKGAQHMPKYYREFDTARERVLVNSLPLQTLLEGSGAAKPQIESAIAATDKSMDDLRWILLHHRFGFGAALIDAKSAVPIQYIGVDPTWIKGEHRLDRTITRP